MSKSTFSPEWQLKAKPAAHVVESLMSELRVSQHLATLIAMRGYNEFSEVKTFFNPSLSQLHNPYLMDDMHKAVGRLALAIERNQAILIYGDYDVDGTTAVALMVNFLREIGANFDYYIPDRYKEGYGISYQGVQYAIDEGFDLFIALDCGIKAVEKVAYAMKNEVDVIICDHHTPGEQLPPAYAILNPKKEGCNYPFKELSGCGIGFKLTQALAEKVGLDDEVFLQNLDLAAISAACDIVPLIGENRLLVHEGMKRIEANPRIGIRKLLGEPVPDRTLTVTDLVFKFGPKINAAGRIDHGSGAVELLIAQSDAEALLLATEIEANNETRKELDRSITEEALSMIENNPEWQQAKSAVLFSPDWHKGVVGIVASRVIETYYKPTIVLTQSDDKVVGSARSVYGFDVYQALCACEEELIQFGGHKYAAGMTLLPEKVDSFRKRFEEVVSSTITDDQLRPKLTIDLELDFSMLTLSFLSTLKRMSPFGPANMKPVFMSTNVRDTGNSRVVGADETHLKVELKQGDTVLQGIAFGMADKLTLLQSGEAVDVAYTVEENFWRGKRSLQLGIKDIRSH